MHIHGLHKYMMMVIGNCSCSFEKKISNEIWTYSNSTFLIKFNLYKSKLFNVHYLSRITKT